MVTKSLLKVEACVIAFFIFSSQTVISSPLPLQEPDKEVRHSVWQSDRNNQQYVFSNHYAGGSIDDPYKWEGGFLKGNDSVKALSLGAEVGIGGMVRPTILETPTLGKVVTIGGRIGLDTGIIYDNGNVEANYMGVGAKVGKDGFKICVFLCLGINWG